MRLAALNGVIVRNLFTGHQLDTFRAGKKLLAVDIEWAEMVLLVPANFPAFKRFSSFVMINLKN